MKLVKIIFLFLLLTDLNYSQSDKSKSLAIIMSLIYPGSGELYLSNFETGEISFLAETGLIGTYSGLNIYGNNLKHDARKFALINSEAKNKQSDLYYSRIGSYNSIYDYNEKILQERLYDDLYLPVENYYWKWNNEVNRKKYHNLRVKSDKFIESSSFVIAGMILNRAISVVRILNNNFTKDWDLNLKNYGNQNNKEISLVFQKRF